MVLFVLLILIAAVAQSVVKLSLLHRFFRIAIPLLLLPLPFILQEPLRHCNLQLFERLLQSGENLRNLCVILVVQEIYSLLAGGALLANLENRRKIRIYQYLALAPSLLVPAGMVLLQMTLFNRFLEADFQRLSSLVAFGSFAVLAGGSELFARYCPDEIKRRTAALNGSWLLLILAVFLPVAIDGQLTETTFEVMAAGDLLPIAALAAIVLASTLIHLAIRKWKDKKQDLA